MEKRPDILPWNHEYHTLLTFSTPHIQAKQYLQEQQQDHWLVQQGAFRGHSVIFRDANQGGHFERQKQNAGAKFPLQYRGS